MTGGAARATFFGQGGDDGLTGGGAADRLTGGIGADILAGGNGNEVFDYDAVAHSTVDVSGTDTITDFNETAADKIDLLTIDANSAAAGNNAFSFIDGAAFANLGQVRVSQSGGDTIVEMNTTGTTDADMRIVLTGLHTLDAADFVL